MRRLVLQLYGLRNDILFKLRCGIVDWYRKVALVKIMNVIVPSNRVEARVGCLYTRWSTSDQRIYSDCWKEPEQRNVNIGECHGGERLSYVMLPAHLVQLYILSVESCHGHTLHFV